MLTPGRFSSTCHGANRPARSETGSALRARSSTVREITQRFWSSTSAIYEFLCIALAIPVTSKISLNSGLLS